MSTRRLPPDLVEAALQGHAAGKSTAIIANEVGLNAHAVRGIIYRSGLGLRTSKKNIEDSHSPETIKLVEELGETHLSIKDIAIQANCSPAGVRRIIKRAGIDRVAWPPEVVARIVSLREHGVSLNSISLQTNVPRNSVAFILRTANVRLDANTRQRLAAEGLPVDQRGLTQEQKLLALSMRRAGIRVKLIAKAFDCKPKAVIKFFSSSRVVLNSEQRQAARFRPSKHTWDSVRARCDALGMVLKSPETGPLSRIEDIETEITCFCSAILKPNLFDFLYGKIVSCGCIRSKQEREIADLLSSWGLEIDRNGRKLIRPYELDIYIPELKVAVEYCGLYWHGERTDGAKEARIAHLRKLKMCRALGIRLITIFADEWKERPETVKAYLQAIVGRTPRSMGARELGVVASAIKPVRAFLDTNHLQGAAGTQAFSLVAEGHTRAVMTFKRVAQQPGQWELTRYCVEPGLAIHGGFQKLLSAFIKEWKPTKIVSFSDNRWSDGGAYDRAGWTREADIRPDYSYFHKGTDGPRRHKSNYRKSRIGCAPGQKEFDRMLELGFDRIWDCGKIRWGLTPTY